MTLCDVKFCSHLATWQRGTNDLATYACDEHGPSATDMTGWRRMEGSAEMNRGDTITADNIPLREVDQRLLDRLTTSLTNITPDREQIERIEAVREQAKELAVVICAYCPDSRERSLAATHLEDAVMWAVKSIVTEST